MATGRDSKAPFLDRYKVLSVRKPGQRGTKKLVAQYGSRLRAVRYLYDRRTGQTLRTVELVLVAPTVGPCELNLADLVGVRIAFHEIELREKLRQLGGRWNPHDKVWIIRHQHLETLGLQNRELVIREESPPYVTPGRQPKTSPHPAP
jgi:hypothetical protein